MLLASVSCKLQILMFCFQSLKQKQLDISGVATLHIPTPAVTTPPDQRFVTLSQPQLPHPADQSLPPHQLCSTAICLPFQSQLSGNAASGTTNISLTSSSWLKAARRRWIRQGQMRQEAVQTPDSGTQQCRRVSWPRQVGGHPGRIPVSGEVLSL